MNAEKNKSIASSWINAFNQHNIHLLLSLYDDYAEHFSPKLKIKRPETGGYIKGKADLFAWWEDAFRLFPTLRYELKNLVADENAVFMEYIRYVDGDENLPVGEVLEIKNDLIVFSRVYHG